MPLRSHRLENRSRSGLMTSTKLPARNLAMTPRSKWPNIDADRLIAKERRMSENAEATAVASFSPCPTCRQYSHSIGEAQHNQAYIHFQSMIDHTVRGYLMANAFDDQTQDAGAVPMASTSTHLDNLKQPRQESSEDVPAKGGTD